MIVIQPQYLSLAKLLAGRLFRIPEYQRAYSWTSVQRRDLFGDIQKVHEKGPDEGHFMAAVVCLRRGKQALGTDEFDQVEIVDGQQRLTTLIILLNAIKLRLNVNDRGEQKLADEIGELLVKMEGDELLLLQTNHDSSHHFALYLRNGTAEPSTTAKTTSDREILSAVEDCSQFVGSWTEKNGALPALAALLKNRLFFLLHEINDEKMVYTVFEVLNSRGLAVSWLDRLKSMLMGSAFELPRANNKGLVEDLHTTWRHIYSVVGLRQGLSTEALRFAATLRMQESPSRPLGEQDSVALLRTIASDATGIRDVASWMLRVTKACDSVTASTRINAVTAISQARLLATAISLREDISGKQREALLARWEKVTFRIYGMLRNDARTRVGDYVRLAWRVVNEGLSVQAISAAIGEIGREFTVERATASLRKANCYEGWETELRYFMFRYEEHLAKVQKLNFRNEQWERIWLVNPAASIEHIWADSVATQSSRHRLGNLLLLPPRLNSTLQDDSPREKVDAYRQTGLLIAREVADRIESAPWNGRAIEARENDLLEWASVEWSD